MADETLIALTADIVASHVSNNTISTDELTGLIKAVYDALANAGTTPEVIEEKREPAVSVRSSVKADAIACLECGKKMKMLKRHLSTDHGLTIPEYKARWNLASDYPTVAPDYAAKRTELALTNGLGRKPGTKVVKKIL